MDRIHLPLIASAALLFTVPAADAATYRAAAIGVEVRVRGRTATVTYADPVCGLRTARRLRVRDGRFRRRVTAVCELSLTDTRTSRAIVVARITRRTVRGRIDGRPFLARRGGGRLTRAQRCALRGATIAETPLVRVFAEDLRTIACRRTDGMGFELGRIDWDEARYYATGVDAGFVQATGSVIAYARSPVDLARSKYAQDPGYETDIIVRDLISGTATRTRAQVFSVRGLAMSDDGAVAWAGAPGAYSYRDVMVQTIQDGEVVTLDRGPIEPQSLRVVDGRFVWESR